MPKIVLTGLQHEQVEFPKDMEAPKSRKGGSLHLQRGVRRDVTVEELEFIRTKRAELYRHLKVEPEPRVAGATKAKLEAAQKAKTEKKEAPKKKFDPVVKDAKTGKVLVPKPKKKSDKPTSG